MDESIVSHFEKIAAQYPTRIALSLSHKNLTYAVVNRAANHIAHHIITRYGRSNKPIAVIMNQDAPLMVAVLAILKASKIAVVLNPSDTSHRILQVLEDVDPHMLITNKQNSCLTDQFASSGMDIYYLEDSLEENLKNPGLLIEASQLGFLIYTSGTTGRPKGVMQTHKNILHSVWRLTHGMELTLEDRVIQLAPVSGAQGLLTAFCALLNGCSLYPYPIMDKGLAHLSKWMIDKAISVYVSTTSIFRSFMQTIIDNLVFQDVRVVRLGSEMATMHDLELWRAHFTSNSFLLNTFGSSEALIVTYQRFEYFEEVTAPLLPVGSILPDTTIELYDDEGKLVAENESGEVLIRSTFLSPGYWRNSSLTEKHFQSFDGELPAFYSGDIARYDGSRLTLLGRRDNQVKINGYRVELSEVESAILKHPAVKEAVIISRGEPTFQIVAYWVPSISFDNAQQIDLRTFVGTILPNYMIPHFFICLTHLPLMPNGKMDRHYLKNNPLPDRETELVAPTNSIETELIKIWIEILNCQFISVTDNFFNLGGHSLQGMQLIARINVIFNVDLNIIVLYCHPVLSELAEEISALQMSGKVSLLPPLVSKFEKPEHIALSSSQGGVWLVNHLPNSSHLYQILFLYNLKGVICFDALKRSIYALMQRHEQLRTRIKLIKGSPYQELTDEKTELKQIYDVNKDNLLFHLDTILSQGFDLNGGLLFQPYLLTISNEESILVLHMHHMITDGWSKQILQRDLSLYYNAYIQHKEIQLQPLPLSYIDYISWVREWQTQDWLKQGADFWKDYLEDAPALLDLPTDYVRTKEQEYEGGIVSFVLPSEVVESLNQFAANRHMSLYMLLLTVFKVLLHHYSGEEKIVVGCATANRMAPQLEDIVGFFVNTIVLATNLSGETDWDSAFKLVKQSTLQALEYSSYPFEALVKALNPLRHLNYHPIFQVFFNYINVPKGELQLEGMQCIELTKTHTLDEPFDLSMTLITKGNKILCQLSYNKKLFKLETIQRWASHYQQLLPIAIKETTTQVGVTDFLLAHEKELLLTRLHGPTIDFPQLETVISRLEKIALAHPEDIAIICGNESLNYKQLNEKTTAIARKLITEGAQPNTLIAISVERSLDMVIGLLGIWKAGAGYVPLNPHDPRYRLEYVLNETKCTIFLINSDSRPILHDLNFSGKILLMDSDIATQHVILPKVNPDHVAYVLYTSGSTGSPKGVVVNHRGVYSYLWSAQRDFSLKENGRFLQYAPYTFDETLVDLYLPLISKVTVVIPDVERYRDLHYITDLIHQERINYVNGVPSFLRLLGKALPGNYRGSLEQVYSIGEELLPSDVQLFYDKCRINVINRYGQTETIGTVTQGACSTAEEIVTLGGAINNTRLYILNEQLRPVPLGCYGELYVAKNYLSKGYLNQPELTAKHFLDNPFATELDLQSGHFLNIYKTGDKVRWLSDGRLEFAGRIDAQVKIRGNRVELGEIESVMSNHSHVQSISVLKISEQLIAFVVLKNTIDVNTLRNYASKHLPIYMLPAHWMIIDEMPITKHGKLDKQSLLNTVNPEEIANLNTLFIEPETAEERVLAKIWCKVLKVDRVGLNDNFFDLGGDSLLGMQLIGNINNSYNINLNISQLFQRATLSELTKEILDLQASGKESHLPPFMLSSEKLHSSILSSSQRQVWLVNQLPDSGHLYQFVFSYSLKGSLSLDALEHSIHALMQRHQQLRIRIKLIDGVPYQEVVDERVWLKIISNVNKGDLQTHIDNIIAEGFSLSGGTLFQAYLFALSEGGEHVFVLHMHHMVTDGWSNQLLKRDLCLYYNAYLQNSEADLPALSMSYMYYILWMNEWQTQNWFKQATAFWEDYLEDAPALLELPTDYAREGEQTYEGGIVSFLLPAKLVRSLNAFATSHYMSLYMVLLTVFKGLLQHYTGEEKIVVGCAAANRMAPQLENIVGFFVNTLVLATALPSGATWDKAFELVKQSTLRALEYSSYPFEALMKALNPVRHLSYHPIFQVFFNFINVPKGEFQLEGLVCAELPKTYTLDEPFDLSMTLVNKVDEILCQLSYNKKLFKLETIERWANHYQKLLRLSIDEVKKPLGSSDFLLHEEKELLFKQFQAPTVDYCYTETVISQFEMIAKAHPDSIALICGEEALSYEALNRKAIDLAKVLVQEGVEPNTLVGISMERSLDMVIGLLAIWKAGAGYVPLSPRDPRSRLEYVLKETNCSLLLLNNSSQALLQGINFSGKYLILGEQINFESYATLPMVHPDNIAYVLYTSGSTGIPKGVLVDHQGVWGYLWSAKRDFALKAGSRFLQYAPFTFDETLVDLYLPLISKVTVVIPEADKYRDLHYITNLIKKERINYVNGVPSFLRLLGETLPLNYQGTLEHVFSIGEPLLPSDVELFYDRGGINVINRYGQTETIGTVTQGLCSPEEKIVSLGHSIKNTRLYILNSQLQLVPLGCYGELYVAKAFLSKGYFNQPQLTSKHFLANAFATDLDHESGHFLTMFKTGDKVRWLSDGRLEFAGRIDAQVKIRGNRVELGEIESVMSNHPVIQSIAVLKVSEQLIAFVVLKNTIELSELRNYASKHLPVYMLPAYWLTIPEMPVTKHGKLDKKVLFDLANQEEINNVSDTLFIAPETAEERALAKIWCKVLKVDRVGLNDNFFDLGGDSLLAMQLFFEIEKEWEIAAPLEIVYQIKTLAEMNGKISVFSLNTKIRDFKNNISNVLQDTDSIEIDVKTPLDIQDYRKIYAVAMNSKAPPLTPGSLLMGMNLQGGKTPVFWCGGTNEPIVFSNCFSQDRPVYMMRSGAMIIDSFAQETFIQKLITHYVEEILQVQPHGPYIIGGNCVGARVAVEISKELTRREKLIKHLLLLEYFNEYLFDFSGDLFLIFAKESHLQLEKKFNWGTTDWEKVFIKMPKVEFISGAHGIFGSIPRIKEVGQLIANYLLNVEKMKFLDHTECEQV